MQLLKLFSLTGTVSTSPNLAKEGARVKYECRTNSKRMLGYGCRTNSHFEFYLHEIANYNKTREAQYYGKEDEGI